jgi:hypothetical protein
MNTLAILLSLLLLLACVCEKSAAAPAPISAPTPVPAEPTLQGTVHPSANVFPFPPIHRPHTPHTPHTAHTHTVNVFPFASDLLLYTLDATQNTQSVVQEACPGDVLSFSTCTVSYPGLDDSYIRLYLDDVQVNTTILLYYYTTSLPPYLKCYTMLYINPPPSLYCHPPVPIPTYDVQVAENDNRDHRASMGLRGMGYMGYMGYMGGMGGMGGMVGMHTGGCSEIVYTYPGSRCESLELRLGCGSTGDAEGCQMTATVYVTTTTYDD